MRCSLFPKAESPDELQRAGYPESARFLRWIAKHGSSALFFSEVEVLVDLARGEKVLLRDGTHYTLPTNEREKFFSDWYGLLGKCTAEDLRDFPAALRSLREFLKGCSRIREAS